MWVNSLAEIGILPENRKRMEDSEFYAEHGMTKEEYEERYGKGAVYVASLPPDVREAELAKAREEQIKQDQAMMEDLELEAAEREARKKEEIAYKGRGDRTQEEYDAYMAAQKAEYYAKKEHVKTYRGVEIYRNPNGSYMAEVNNKGLSTSDLYTMEYLIDAELDSGSAEAEIQQSELALYEKTRERREPFSREDEISSSPEVVTVLPYEPDVTPAPAPAPDPEPEPIPTAYDRYETRRLVR